MGTLKLNGGLLNITENTDFNTNIDHLVSSISVQPQKTLKYAGDSIEIGALHFNAFLEEEQLRIQITDSG